MERAWLRDDIPEPLSYLVAELLSLESPTSRDCKGEMSKLLRQILIVCSAYS